MTASALTALRNLLVDTRYTSPKRAEELTFQSPLGLGVLDIFVRDSSRSVRFSAGDIADPDLSAEVSRNLDEMSAALRSMPELVGSAGRGLTSYLDLLKTAHAFLREKEGERHEDVLDVTSTTARLYALRRSYELRTSGESSPALRGLPKNAIYHGLGLGLVSPVIEASRALGLQPSIINWIFEHAELAKKFTLRPIEMRERGANPRWVRIGAIELPDLGYENLYGGLHAMILRSHHDGLVPANESVVYDAFMRYAEASKRTRHMNGMPYSHRIAEKSIPAVAAFLFRTFSEGGAFSVDDMMAGLHIYFGHGYDQRVAMLHDTRGGFYVVPATFDEELDSIREPDGTEPTVMTVESFVNTADAVPVASREKKAVRREDAVEQAEQYYALKKDELRRHFNLIDVEIERPAPVVEKGGRVKMEGGAAKIKAVEVPEGFTSVVQEVYHMLEHALENNLASTPEERPIRNILEAWSKNPAGFSLGDERQYVQLAGFLHRTFRLGKLTGAGAVECALKIAFNFMGVRDNLPVVLTKLAYTTTVNGRNFFEEKRVAVAPPGIRKLWMDGEELLMEDFGLAYGWRPGSKLSTLDYWRQRAILLRRDFDIAPAAFRDANEISRPIGALVFPAGLTTPLDQVRRALSVLHKSKDRTRLPEIERQLLDQLVSGGQRIKTAEGVYMGLARFLSPNVKIDGRNLAWDDWFGLLLIHGDHDGIKKHLPLYSESERMYDVPDQATGGFMVGGTNTRRRSTVSRPNPSTRPMELLKRGTQFDADTEFDFTSASGFLDMAELFIRSSPGQLDRSAFLTLVEKVIATKGHFGANLDKAVAVLAHFLWVTAADKPRIGEEAAVAILERAGYPGLSAVKILAIFPNAFPSSPAEQIAKRLREASAPHRAKARAGISGAGGNGGARNPVPRTLSVEDVDLMTRARMRGQDISAAKARQIAGLAKDWFFLKVRKDMDHLFPGGNYRFALTKDRKLAVAIPQCGTRMREAFPDALRGMFRFSEDLRTALVDGNPQDAVLKRVVPFFKKLGFSASLKPDLLTDPVENRNDKGGNGGGASSMPEDGSSSPPPALDEGPLAAMAMGGPLIDPAMSFVPAALVPAAFSMLSF